MSKKKTAVITGVAGQDGSYLAEYLLSIGYLVIGITKRNSHFSFFKNLEGFISNKNFTLLEGDITDSTLIYSVAKEYRPDEWYNLAAMSHVGQSFKEPLLTFDVDAKAVLTQLNAIKQFSPETKFYQASTSELYGGINAPENGYNESSPFNPRSPYAIAKLAAYWSVVNYRQSYNLFATNGILFNHSSPRRGFDFATRKITRGIAGIKLGIIKKIKMGDLSAFRDEGHSKDYVRAMHLMLQNSKAEDFVISTGSGASIEEMFRYVASIADISFEEIYEKDPEYLRPSDVPYLLGDSKKAKDVLGWIPEYNWKTLLEEMYEQDLASLK